MKALADTGFLVAFGNRRDRHHNWAIEIAQRVSEPLLTCEAVLAEAAFQLDSARLVLGLVREGLVRPAFVVNDHLARLAELAERYADRKPDLADLCLIRMSELHPALPLITTDLRDFGVYRRGRRELIPLIHPPTAQKRWGAHHAPGSGRRISGAPRALTATPDAVRMAVSEL